MMVVIAFGQIAAGILLILSGVLAIQNGVFEFLAGLDILFGLYCLYKSVFKIAPPTTGE